MNGDLRHCEHQKDGTRCPILFTQRSNGQRFCDDCARKRKLIQNKASQRATRDDQQLVDLSPAMVDRIFEQALKDIRKSGVHRVEAASWNYAGRYREP